MNQTNENQTVSQDDAFPDGFLQLFFNTKIENANESLIVLLHALLLEVGFIPKDLDQFNGNTCMPENWKSSGTYKILYYHKDIPNAFCWFTCVPLYSNLAVHGTLEQKQPQDSSVYLKLKVNSFVNTEGDLSNPSSTFIHPGELSRLFKDEFCFSLLVLLQESMDYKPSFGLNGLVDEVKVSVLKLLPVESVVALSAVNKSFYQHANSPFLWKFLFLRDYGSENLESGTSSTDENWKEKYKDKHLRARIQRHHDMTPLPIYHPYLPAMFPVNPNYDVDQRIDMDPALQQAFPLMRSRFRPSTWFYPRNDLSFYHGFL